MILKQYFTQYENSALQTMYVEVGVILEFSLSPLLLNHYAPVKNENYYAQNYASIMCQCLP